MTNRISSTIGEGLEVDVEFDHSPGRDAKLYGDDPHPEEPAELDLTSIWAVCDVKRNNIIHSLTEDELGLMVDLCWRKVGEDKENIYDG